MLNALRHLTLLKNNMVQAFISICIPVYNGEIYLRKCLDSCLSQDYSNYEVLVCDDGSTDASMQIVLEYQNKYPQLVVFENEKNLGLVGNWNRCVELAKGEWVKFVFQDDYISKNCLLEFAAVMEESTQLIVSKRHFILPQGHNENTHNYYTQIVRTLENSCRATGNVYPSKTICDAAIKYMCMNFIGEPSLSCFRKSITSEIGWYNKDLKQICDLEFALRIACKYGLTYIPQQICSFRIHENSTTSTNINSKYFELRYIEPVLLSYVLLFDDTFTAFRKHLNILQLFKLKIYFKVKTYKASQINSSQQHGHFLFEGSPQRFPHVANHKKGSWWVKLLSILLRQ